MNRHRALRRALIEWYDRNRRDLPWRRTRDPYAIWISETMLQQTRVETVIPYYEQFLRRFPTIQALADSDPDELMERWAGLGYYRRARNLRAAAVKIAHEHDGRLPEEVDELRGLPGVGRYTAGAVASIAFDRPAPIVDGNVRRVFSRLFEIREDIGSAPVVARLWEEAAELARGARPGDLNQAVMELGAVVCTPRTPRCQACPVARRCGARAAGDPEALPIKKTRKAPREVVSVAGWVARRGRWLAARRPPVGLLGGLWEMPGGDLEAGETPEEAIGRALRERLGLVVKEVRPLGSVSHQFSHRSLELHVLEAAVAEGRVRRAGYDAHRWLSRRAFGALPLSAIAQKAIGLASDPR